MSNITTNPTPVDNHRITQGSADALAGPLGPAYRHRGGTAMILPAEVAERDKQLDAEIARTTEELMELRWHWTLDTTNPDRVTAAAYGRAVGRARQVISGDANAWARWLTDQSKRTHMGAAQVGEPHTPDDYRQLVKLSDEREQVVRAVARANNKKFSNVAVNMRKEVNEALTEAQDRAERNGTTVATEITEAAKFLAKFPSEVQKDAALSEAGKKYWAEKKAAEAKCRPEYLALQKRIDAAVSALENDLCDAGTIAFTKEETDALHGSLDRLSVLVGQVQTRIGKASGSGTVDLDNVVELKSAGTR
jgi:hypothetical protein